MNRAIDNPELWMAAAPKRIARPSRSLAFLAPDIQRAILEGRQPPSFNLEGLAHSSIPLAWADQSTAFGF